MSDTTKCEAQGCTLDARMAIRTTRPTRENVQNVVYSDNRSAPKMAMRYCKAHGIETIRRVLEMLVDGDDTSDPLFVPEIGISEYLCRKCRHAFYMHRESTEWQRLNPRRKNSLTGCARDGCDCTAADDSHVGTLE